MRNLLLLTGAVLVQMGIILILAAPVSAQVVPYWIPDDGCTLGYGPDGVAVEWYEGRESPLEMVHTMDHLDFRFDQYDRDDDDLFLTDQVYAGMEDHRFSYDPPLKCLDMPLTTGKTWTSESVRTREGGGSAPQTHVLTCTVVGPRIVDTILGPLDVIEVIRELTISSSYTTVSTLLLNDQFGNVNDLVSLSNCATVATEGLSWGEVKALYR